MKNERMTAMVVVVAVLGVLMGPWTATSAAADFKASEPRPADGASGVKMPLLQWTPGGTAAWHNLYLGTNAHLTEADLVAPRQPFSMYFHMPGFEPGVTYYWRVDEVEAGGTVYTGDLWSFTTLSGAASNPSPPNGAESVAPDTKLTWTPGADAIAHEVYFGTNEAAVASGADDAFMGTTIAHTYDPGILNWGTTYYWRVDEKEGGGPRTGGGATYTGPVWHFTTAEEGQGVVYRVRARGGSDDNDGMSVETAFATIQKGIDAALDGDTILVYPGVYREPVDFLGKAITVRSVERAAVLRVRDDFAVSFYMGEGRGSVLENFIIRDSFIGIFIVQSAPTIRNVTLVGNKYGVEAYAQAEPDISNCIFWYNTADDLFGSPARYSCIERGAPGAGNFSDDPLFADPNAGDYHLRSERGRYWPEHDVWVLDKVSSPCLDAGDPNADYSHELTPNGGRINLGAYGGTAYASFSEAINQPPEIVITAPADGTSAMRAETVAVEAEAKDIDGYVVKVEFFANGEKIGQDTDGCDGWAMEWKYGPVGEFELIARATDNEGAVADSAAIGIWLHTR